MIVMQGGKGDIDYALHFPVGGGLSMDVWGPSSDGHQGSEGNVFEGDGGCRGRSS